MSALARCICGGIKWNQTASINVASADVTLTSEEEGCSDMRFTGSPGVARTVTLASAASGMVWMVYNGSDASVTLKVSGATGIAVGTLKRCILMSDGTDVRRYSADV
jgi:hypothetical protein